MEMGLFRKFRGHNIKLSTMGANHTLCVYGTHSTNRRPLNGGSVQDFNFVGLENCICRDDDKLMDLGRGNDHSVARVVMNGGQLG